MRFAATSNAPSPITIAHLDRRRRHGPLRTRPRHFGQQSFAPRTARRRSRRSRCSRSTSCSWPCDARVEELMSGKPHLERIVVRRPRLRAVRQADGALERRQRSCRCRNSATTRREMQIEDATLILEDATRHAVAPLSLRGIDIKLTPGEPASATGRTGSPFAQRHPAPPPARRPASSHSPAPSRLDDGTLDLAVEIRGLEVSPELVAAIPGPLPAELHGVELYCQRRRHGPPVAHDARRRAARLVGRRVAHPRPARPRTAAAAAHRTGREDSGRFPASSSSSSSPAKLGAADVALACEPTGLGRQRAARPGRPHPGPGGELRIAGRAPGAARAALAAFPAERNRRRRSPAHLRRPAVAAGTDGPLPRPLAHRRREIPLPARTGHGHRLAHSLADDRRHAARPVGHGDGRPIRIAPSSIAHHGQDSVDQMARVPSHSATGGNARRRPACQRDDRCRGASQADRLDRSLRQRRRHPRATPGRPARQSPAVRPLAAAAGIDRLPLAVRTDSIPLAARGDTSLELKLADCAIQYERFPYPLQQIRGLVTARNGHYTLSDLQGRDRQGSAIVTCQGESQADAAGLAVHLVFRGTQRAARRQSQAIALAAGATGVDRPATARPHQFHRQRRARTRPGQAGRSKSSLRAARTDRFPSSRRAFPIASSKSTAGRSSPTAASISQQLQGRHGRVDVFRRRGIWQATPDGGWQLVLSGLNADRLDASSRDLLGALPPGVQKVIDRLRPAGNFDALQLDAQLRTPPEHRRRSPPRWDVQLACHQAALRGDLPLENLTGGIRLMGQCDGPNCSSYGELAIDSLIWNDMQLTNVRGPFWSDNAALLIRPAGDRRSWPSRRVASRPTSTAAPWPADVQSAARRAARATTPRFRSAASTWAAFARERLGGPERPHRHGLRQAVARRHRPLDLRAQRHRRSARRRRQHLPVAAAGGAC